MARWTASAKWAAGPALDGQRDMPLALRLSEGCAPSMGANLWGGSPLWECRLGLIVSKDNHEPKARAMSRGMVWRKLECKRCEATDCKPHSQGRGMLLAMAHGSKAHRYAAYGKCGACASTVRVLTWGDLHRVRCVWIGETPDGSTGISRTRRCGELPAACDETAAPPVQAHSAARGNARRDGAEVSKRRSRWPGVGLLKG